ncbi:MAG: helix-turn-helix domain-containing protein, partial [Bacteroidales bacterium]|nr:helix-turn-helix domain-containing protein [Bacteroidales bacterium]
QQVADYLGFKSTARISKWEKGVQWPHVRHFIKIVELYQVAPLELYEK